jgi:DNA (cytosine-5)-methyltransferase 1
VTLYNDIEPFVLEWTNNLMEAGLVSPGKVDGRPIQMLEPEDLMGYERVHFFSGCAGWELALNLSGWTGPVWSGSCPCQPFSAAGKRKGKQDERHLWPEFFRLISAVRPPIVIGEQVASKDGLAWLDGVQDDFERAHYAFWAVDLSAASYGLPHIRQRLYWGAYRLDDANRERPEESKSQDSPGGQCGIRQLVQGSRGTYSGLAHSECPGIWMPGHRENGAETSGVQGEDGERERLWTDTGSGSNAECGRMAHSDEPQLQREPRPWEQPLQEQDRGTSDRRLGHTSGPRLQERGSQRGVQSGTGEPPKGETTELSSAGLAPILLGYSGSHEPIREQEGRALNGGTCASFIQCRDGKTRRISAQPGDEPLAYALPLKLGPLLPRLEKLAGGTAGAKRLAREFRRNRTGRLKAYGNSLAIPCAVAFLKAFQSALADLMSSVRNGEAPQRPH